MMKDSSQPIALPADSRADTTVNPVTPDWVLYSASGVLFFLFGLGASFIFTSWDTISTLFYESSLARYETMTGDRGPATFLVFHDNILQDLQTLAAVTEDILGVEQDPRSNVAKIAFTSSDVSAIETVKQMAGVTSMLRRNMPMMCH